MLDNLSTSAFASERDPLSEVLQDLRISGVEYGYCGLSRP
ncbi:AraC family transcriptional regulator, partial [Mesorhizobium sp. M8A.F.Ca.ET.023.01.1.1]